MDDRFKEEYNKMKRLYNEKLRIRRSTNYKEKLNSSDNKSKAVWEIIQDITGKGRNGQRGFWSENNAKTLANEYNNFLANVCPPTSISKNIGHYITPNKESMFLKRTNSTEILNIVKHFKNKISSGYDEVPMKVVKLCIDDLVDPIVYLVNSSLKSGIFPSILRTALVKPIFKGGNPSELNNYRPISQLTTFSKILETVVCRRLVEFMEIRGLFSKCQHAYQRGKSTMTAIFQFTQSILEHLEEGHRTVGLFLDLSKAFDSLDHSTLLYKLEAYGIRGPAYNWFVSYLTGRKRIVAINMLNDHGISDEMTVEVGVPQGSVVGPVLFIIYVNDLENGTCVHCKLTTFADDTTLLVGAPDGNNIVSITDDCLLDAQKWFENNNLILNKNKTKIVMFTTNSPCVNKPEEIHLSLGNFQITDETDFLGLRIDSKLNFDQHVQKNCKKLNSALYSIRITSRYLDKETLKILYYANFESVCRYGIIFYGSCGGFDRVFKIQKKTLRTMLKMRWRESCRGKFRSFNLLTIPAVYIQELLLFFFKNQSLFEHSRPQNIYKTRTLDYMYPRHRLTITEKSPLYQAIRMFNKLPTTYKEMNSLVDFKGAIHKMLLKIEPYSVSEFLD